MVKTLLKLATAVTTFITRLISYDSNKKDSITQNATGNNSIIQNAGRDIINK